MLIKPVLTSSGCVKYWFQLTDCDSMITQKTKALLDRSLHSLQDDFILLRTDFAETSTRPWGTFKALTFCGVNASITESWEHGSIAVRVAWLVLHTSWPCFCVSMAIQGVSVCQNKPQQQLPDTVRCSPLWLTGTDTLQHHLSPSISLFLFISSLLISSFHPVCLCCPPLKGNSTEIIYELCRHRCSYLRFPSSLLFLSDLFSPDTWTGVSVPTHIKSLQNSRD